MLSGEGKQPLRERCRTVRAIDRAFDESLHIGLSPFEPPLQQTKAADDDCQHIVEVVRNTSCELANGLNFLHMANLTFGLFTAVDFRLEFFIGDGQFPGPLFDPFFQTEINVVKKLLCAFAV